MRENADQNNSEYGHFSRGILYYRVLLISKDLEYLRRSTRFSIRLSTCSICLSTLIAHSTRSWSLSVGNYLPVFS